MNLRRFMDCLDLRCSRLRSVLTYCPVRARRNFQNELSRSMRSCARVCLANALTMRMPKPIFLLISKSAGSPTPSSLTEI